jgi:peptidoglycan/LPS O-acetylase OafA/YrhL
MTASGTVQDMPEPSAGLSERYFGLDALRGLAALTVVAFHWRHFFYRGVNPPETLDASRFPFGAAFTGIVRHGDLAVDLFFILSGFIFYSVYSNAIATRQVGKWDFFVSRFSRLYPLALATLLLVAVLQAVMLRTTGSYFIYPANDAFTFILHLFMASDWGIQVAAPYFGFIRGHGFDAPIWSVSVEVLLYYFFFVLCVTRRSSAWWAAMGMVAGFAFMLVYTPLGRGVWCFFMGALVYYASRWLSAQPAVYRRIPLVVAGVVWIGLTSAEFDPRATVFPVQPVLGSTPLYEYLVWTTLAFPSAVLTLALYEERWSRGMRRLKFLGDISYSTYLLHFPLQILFVLVGTWLSVGTEFYMHESTFILFTVILILLSLVTFHWFEYPARQRLRRFLGGFKRQVPLKRILPEVRAAGGRASE